MHAHHILSMHLRNAVQQNPPSVAGKNPCFTTVIFLYPPNRRRARAKCPLGVEDSCTRKLGEQQPPCSAEGRMRRGLEPVQPSRGTSLRPNTPRRGWTFIFCQTQGRVAQPRTIRMHETTPSKCAGAETTTLEKNAECVATEELLDREVLDFAHPPNGPLAGK